MKKLLVLAVVALAGIALADRTEVWLSNSVNVQKVYLSKLADGGCSVRAEALTTKQDGGSALDSSKDLEVSGVNRTDCLNIIDTRAPVLFKADKGL